MALTISGMTQRTLFQQLRELQRAGPWSALFTRRRHYSLWESLCGHFSIVGSTASLVSYNSSDELKERHNLPQEMLLNIAVIEILAASAGE